MVLSLRRRMGGDTLGDSLSRLGKRLIAQSELVVLTSHSEKSFPRICQNRAHRAQKAKFRQDQAKIGQDRESARALISGSLDLRHSRFFDPQIHDEPGASDSGQRDWED